MSDRANDQKAQARTALAMVVTMLALMFAALVWASSADAQEPYAEQTPEVLPTVIVQVEVEPRVAEAPEAPPRAPLELPITGADLTLFVGTGLAAIATGTLILRRVRGKRPRE